MEPANIRKTLLETIAANTRERNAFSAEGVLSATGRQLGLGNNQEDLQQAVLACWHDLFISGQIAWGANLSNSQPPWFHLTNRGRETLKHLSRDPINRDGYMQYLTTQAAIPPVPASYVEEALRTYSASCWKATAVMIGGAAEGLVLDLRDAVVDRLNALGNPIPKSLKDWKVKAVMDTLDQVLGNAKPPKMPTPLAEALAAYWPAFVQQIRSGRNEAGHPTSINPVTPEDVHAALLVFPNLARLAAQLKTWVMAAAL